MLDVIHTKVCIKVDEDVFFVTVARESVDVADRMGGFELVRGGYDNTASPPSFSISVVPDSFCQDIVGDQIPGPVLPSQGAVHNSKCNAEKQVMIADTDREDRDNDESESEKVGTAELSQEVMAQEQVFGFVEDCRGLGNRREETERPNDFRRPVNGSSSPYAGISQHKIATRMGQNAKKKQMEEILQLQLFKRIILAENENPNCRKIGLSLREIYAFLSQLEVVEERNVEETVQRIADMEKRDAMLFSGEMQPKRVDSDEECGGFSNSVLFGPMSCCCLGLVRMRGIPYLDGIKRNVFRSYDQRGSASSSVSSFSSIGARFPPEHC
ncbi:hypothetical protein Ancab_019004 [Ancistrocladus abbreviatus]